MGELVYDFGRQLKELRDKKGLTQKQVGEIVGVNDNSISNYERNIDEPTFQTLKRLALLFGVSTDYLLGLEEIKKYVFYLDNLGCLSEDAANIAEGVLNLIEKECQSAQSEKE